MLLFEPRTSGMELTSFGQALPPYATHLTHEANLAIEESNRRLGLGRGLVRIGTVASDAIVVLPRVLDQMLAKWPNLPIEILEPVEEKLAGDLARNDIDVVMSGPIAENDDVMKVGGHRFTDRSVVIAAASHPLAQRARVTLNEVRSLPWIMPHPGAEARKRFDDLVHRLGAQLPRVAIETRSPAAGRIRALPVEELVLERRFFIYRRRRNFLPSPLVGLLDVLRR